jgi:hypothetical protein
MPVIVEDKEYIDMDIWKIINSVTPKYSEMITIVRLLTNCNLIAN